MFFLLLLTIFFTIFVYRWLYLKSLIHFIAVFVGISGTEYEPDSIASIKTALTDTFNNKIDIDIKTDKAFNHSRAVLE